MSSSPFPYVWLLAGSQFEDVDVSDGLLALGEQGVPVIVIGQIAGVLRGRTGLLLQVDKTLSQVSYKTEAPSKLLIIAGGTAAAIPLFLDPRVHQLIHTVIEQGGIIALMRGTWKMAVETGVIQAHPKAHFVCQGELDAAAFGEKALYILRTLYTQ